MKKQSPSEVSLPQVASSLTIEQRRKDAQNPDRLLTIPQLQLIEVFADLVEQAKNERLIIIFDNNRLHIADYDTLEAKDYFGTDYINGQYSDEMALNASHRITIDLAPIDVLDKWKFGEAI